MLLVSAGLLLGRPTRVALAGVRGGGVAGEALGADHRVAVVEEHGGVARALDRRDLCCRRALAGGTVRQPAWYILIKYFSIDVRNIF